MHSKPVAALPMTVSRETVGRRLRAIRRRKKLTLKALSALCGVPVSTLSKTELGQASLNYDKLMAIAHALGVEVPVLLQSSSQAAHRHALEARAVKSRLADHDDYATQNYAHTFLFSEISGKAMTPIVATVHSRDVTEFSEFVRHPGHEFAYVLSGAVRIVFEDGRVLDLEAQEVAYFDSAVGHVYLSRSAAPARVLAVCSDWRPSPASSVSPS